MTTPFKTHHSAVSALELQRAYLYLPASQWAAIEALRASTGLSVSHFISHLIIKAVDAKEQRDIIANI